MKSETASIQLQDCLGLYPETSSYLVQLQAILKDLVNQSNLLTQGLMGLVRSSATLLLEGLSYYLVLHSDRKLELPRELALLLYY